MTAVLEHWATSPDHTEQTRARMSETVHRFTRRLQATAPTGAANPGSNSGPGGSGQAGVGGPVGRLAEVTPAHATAFINAPTRHGTLPELTTRHARRTALRMLFRTARLLGHADHDPTLDLELPPRGLTAARPLTDDEVTLCRAASQMTRARDHSLRAVAWALGEATAVSSEITTIRIRDLDDPLHPTRVRLPGTRRHDPRTVTLTPWASQILTTRAAALLAIHPSNPAAPAPPHGGTRHPTDPYDQLLAYGGHAPPGGAKAQASVCNALRHVLHHAGLDDRDLRPASLRNWRGRDLYDHGHTLPEVALALGLRTLDATAEDIALDWRHPTTHATDIPATPDTQSTRNPADHSTNDPADDRSGLRDRHRQPRLRLITQDTP